MSTENEAIARRFFEDLCNGSRHDLADEIILPDWTMHEPQTPSAGTGPQAAVETARV